MIVLGFVVIYRATGIINFAQGGFLLIGAFLTYNFSQTWGWNFYLSLFLSMIVTSIIAILIQLLLLHRSLKEITAGGFCLLIWSVSFYNGNTHLVSLIIGLIAGVFIYFLVRGLEIRFGSSQSNELPIFGSIIVTIGILFVIKQVVPSIWGFAEINMGDPWGFKIIKAGDLVFTHAKLWTIALTAIALLGFFLVNRYTKIGIAMRAAHFDHEAAFAQGISLNVDFSIGTITFFVSIGVLILWIPLKQKPGIGTILNALIIAIMIDVCIKFVPTPENYISQIILAVVAVLTVGLGGGIYLVANLGPGPRDGLMIGLQEISNLPIAVVRAFLEISVVAVGWYLGGTVGIGTLLFAFGIGPAVALGLFLVDKIFNN